MLTIFDNICPEEFNVTVSRIVAFRKFLFIIKIKNENINYRVGFKYTRIRRRIYVIKKMTFFLQFYFQKKKKAVTLINY